MMAFLVSARGFGYKLRAQLGGGTYVGAWGSRADVKTSKPRTAHVLTRAAEFQKKKKLASGKGGRNQPHTTQISGRNSLLLIRVPAHHTKKAVQAHYDIPKDYVFTGTDAVEACRYVNLQVVLAIILALRWKT